MKRILAPAIIMLTVSLALPGYAASAKYWAPTSCALGGAGTWDTVTSQWSPNSTGGSCAVWANANSDYAYFGGTASYTVVNSGNKTLNKIYHTIASEIIVNSSGSLVFSGTGSGIDVVSSGYFSMACPFSGTLTKTSAGRVDANNANSTGKWVISGGYVSFAAPNRLPTSTGSDVITFNGGGFGIGWGSTYTGSQFWGTAQGITVNSGGAFFGASASTDPVYIAAPIVDGTGGTGNGGLNVTTGSPLASPYNAGGVLILTNNTATTNSYKGPTTISASCQIKLAVSNQIPDGSDVTVSGTLALANYSDTINSLSGGGSVTLGSATLTIGNGNSKTFSGAISGTGGLAKSGAGTQTLSGVNTYSGTTTVSAGTLVCSGANTCAGIIQRHRRRARD